MPPKAEYWTLTKEQFNKIKIQINELGEKILDSLKHYEFTKIISTDDWLGLTVEKQEGDLLTFVGFSLIRESPLEFQLVLRKWNVQNPSETRIDFYQKTFNTIEEFESSFNNELKIVKGLLP